MEKSAKTISAPYFWEIPLIMPALWHSLSLPWDKGKSSKSIPGLDSDSHANTSNGKLTNSLEVTANMDICKSDFKGCWG